jgi:hypothetical protein
MSSPASIWYRVFDSYGKQWPKTNATKVLINPLADVDDFRKAILKMYNDEGLTILTGIISSQLLVYRNKQAFDNRDLPIDQGKEEPLEEDSSIVGLEGNKDKDALIVVAPLKASSVREVVMTSNDTFTDFLDKLQSQFNPFLAALADQHQEL